jgi:exonuclease VII large subunit
MIDEQLGAAGRRIDELEARGRHRGAAQRQRLQRRVDVLRTELANALDVARRTPDQADERVARLRSRLEVAERSLRADLAKDGCAFFAEVEAELDSWDTFAERLQTTAAARTGRARERAEAALTKLRHHRLAVGERVRELRTAGRETRREQRTRVTAARDDLEQLADHLLASVFLRRKRE